MANCAIWLTYKTDPMEVNCVRQRYAKLPDGKLLPTGMFGGSFTRPGDSGFLRDNNEMYVAKREEAEAEAVELLKAAPMLANAVVLEVPVHG